MGDNSQQFPVWGLLAGHRLPLLPLRLSHHRDCGVGSAEPVGGFLEEAVRLASPRLASWLQACSRSGRADGGTEGLGGQERALTLSGLAEPPAPICRGAAHPPQVGWETSALRSACSPDILLTADGSHNSPSPCSSGRTSLPFAYPSCQLLCLLLEMGRQPASPPKPPVAGETRCSDCGQFARERRPGFPLVSSGRLRPAQFPQASESPRPNGPAA